MAIKHNFVSPVADGGDPDLVGPNEWNDDHEIEDGSITAEMLADDYALDSDVVHKTGDETVAGVKTFSSSPIVPTPSNGTDAANKDYVDAQASGGGYSDEQAQDAVGTILADSSTIDFTYTDATPEITAAVKSNSISDTHIAAGVDAAKIADGSVSNTEFQRLNGVTSDIQTQLDAKAVKEIGQNSQSAAYTTVLSDSGKHILHPSSDANARTFTIDSNANVAYPIGTAISFINETSQVVTIAITSDTLTLAGTTTTGSRSLAQNGVATAIKITSTKWIISGTGLT